MNWKTYFLGILFLLVISISMAQEVFRFQYKTGQRFHIEGIVDEEVYINDLLVQRARIKNIGDLSVTRIEGERALHEGSFLFYQSSGDEKNFILEKEYPSRFYRDIYGNYVIDEQFFMPVVRGVPTFPKTALEVGDQWRSNAWEAHDFSNVFGIENPVILPATVSYQYLENVMIDGEKIAKISINYVINYTLQYQQGTVMGTGLPYRVVGYFNQLYFWNLDRGLPYSYRENFDYIFIMSNGDIREYVGSSKATLTVTDVLSENDQVIQSIRSKLQKSIPLVEVTETPQGIVINIGEILFKFDSDELSHNADDDLNNIVEVLRDFPKRKVRIIGHTDSTGPEDYNLSLSMRRAKRTTEELRSRLPKLSRRITYIGMGENKPIASNETEEGRKRNRRVEIMILNE
jgi:outer membrane protein OmpA-like peptidoglycan-associated protein